MRCIVFGGGGFLGSHLCEELLASGYDVTIFEKSSANLQNIRQIADKIMIVRGDFNNSIDVQQALSGCDVIFHLISTTIPETSNDDPALDVQSNIVSTIRMLEIASNLGCRKVVFFSSGGTVYGIPNSTPIQESHNTNPICSYGIQKLTIEKYLHLFHHLYGLDYNVLRVANPYGPRQSPHSGQGVIAAFIQRILHGEAVEVWGDGSVVRDYIYVTDVVKAAVSVVVYCGQQKIFNIGSGKGQSILDIIRSIESVVGDAFDIRYKGARAVDVPINILDITKAKEELAWRPSVGLMEGLSQTIDYLTGEKSVRGARRDNAS